jgi:hypothetical protein
VFQLHCFSACINRRLCILAFKVAEFRSLLLKTYARIIDAALSHFDVKNQVKSSVFSAFNSTLRTSRDTKPALTPHSARGFPVYPPP